MFASSAHNGHSKSGQGLFEKPLPSYAGIHTKRLASFSRLNTTRPPGKSAGSTMCRLFAVPHAGHSTRANAVAPASGISNALEPPPAGNRRSAVIGGLPGYRAGQNNLISFKANTQQVADDKQADFAGGPGKNARGRRLGSEQEEFPRTTLPCGPPERVEPLQRAAAASKVPRVVLRAEDETGRKGPGAGLIALATGMVTLVATAKPACVAQFSSSSRVLRASADGGHQPKAMGMAMAASGSARWSAPFASGHPRWPAGNERPHGFAGHAPPFDEVPVFDQPTAGRARASPFGCDRLRRANARHWSRAPRGSARAAASRRPRMT